MDRRQATEAVRPAAEPRTAEQLMPGAEQIGERADLLAPQAILLLQRRVGNAAVARLVAKQGAPAPSPALEPGDPA